MSKTLVVIFCYNVQENIHFVLKKILKNKINKNRDILFIDDCSTDKTNEILRSYKIKNSKIFRNNKNQGFGLNYKYRAATKNEFDKMIKKMCNDSHEVRQEEFNKIKNWMKQFGSEEKWTNKVLDVI